MSETSQDITAFQSALQERFSHLTSEFHTLKTLIDDSQFKEAIEQTEKLYSRFFDLFQTVLKEMKTQHAETAKYESKIQTLSEEISRLEVLYSSGITLTSELDTQSLLEKAIDIVSRELNADAGFIVLVNAEGEFEQVYSHNMTLADNPDAAEMSRSVVRDALEQAAPVNRGQSASDHHLARRTSIIKLGISAVLSAPLIDNDEVFGAVYLDRRDQASPFTQSDLAYLLSFAKQIVRGLRTSQTLTQLQSELLEDSHLKFSELRQQFHCPEIIGSSPKLFEVLKLANKIADSNAPVLILGESGTGKDLLAKTIHKNSPRHENPFITIDCGAIPTDLLESELFGYEKGAFTGATQAKPGKLELADRGTVFLNEIGEMPVNLQAKLLRIIQTGEVERLGGVETRTINARFIAATNQNIDQQIGAGTFREDLYYRLKVFELYMPALRERKKDIQDLTEYFLRKFAGDNPVPTISNEALHLLQEYHWPGNIRELSNVIQRCVVLADGDTIAVSDLPKEQVEQSDLDPYIETGNTLHEAERTFRKNYILKTLKQAESKTEAAEMLGINRSHFHKLLSQLDISDKK